MITSTRMDSRTTGTADTLIEVGRFLLAARAASRRAASRRTTTAARHPGPGATRPDAPAADDIA